MCTREHTRKSAEVSSLEPLSSSQTQRVKQELRRYLAEKQGTTWPEIH